MVERYQKYSDLFKNRIRKRMLDLMPGASINRWKLQWWFDFKLYIIFATAPAAT